MATPYVGEIRIFAGNFAPQGWALCQGQLLPIAENDVLFALIGTTYGGDGQNTFALPNLAGRIPIHQGTGPGLSNQVIGQLGGSENVTLTTGQLPVHSHTAACSDSGADQVTPGGNFWSTDPGGNTAAYNNTSNKQMAATAVGNSGGGQAHDNMQPFVVIDYIISLFGIFPSQN